MEKNIPPRKVADSRKRRPGFAGAAAAVGGAAVGAAAFTATAAAMSNIDEDLEGEYIEPVEDIQPEAPAGHSSYVQPQSEPDTPALVEPEPFDPNEIMLDIDELDIAIVPANPGELDDMAVADFPFDPITAEDLIIGVDDLDVTIDGPITNENYYAGTEEPYDYSNEPLDGGVDDMSYLDDTVSMDPFAGDF